MGYLKRFLFSSMEMNRSKSLSSLFKIVPGLQLRLVIVFFILPLTMI